jgi:hypothetical protein
MQLADDAGCRPGVLAPSRLRRMRGDGLRHIVLLRLCRRGHGWRPAWPAWRPGHRQTPATGCVIVPPARRRKSDHRGDQLELAHVTSPPIRLELLGWRRGGCSRGLCDGRHANRHGTPVERTAREFHRHPIATVEKPRVVFESQCCGPKSFRVVAGIHKHNRWAVASDGSEATEWRIYDEEDLVGSSGTCCAWLGYPRVSR